MSAKDAKEEFVANLEGTSPWEILLIASSVPLGFYVFLSFDKQRIDHVAEVIAFWIPAILCQSVYSFPWAVLYFILCLAVGKMMGGGSNTNSSTITRSPQQLQHDGITIYRAGLLCLTCVAILAVDFHIYPRRLAKTERYGYGWMDLGAASFVIDAGMVSRRAKHKQKHTPSFQRVLPILFMGMLRLVTHKGIEYQEHASEYGVHWNFFFTLGMLTPLSFLPMPHYSVVIVIMGIYQYILTYNGLQDWVETAPRMCASSSILCDFVYANREGILGCIGYSSLYVASEWMASVTIWSQKNQPCVGNMWKLAAVLGVAWWLLDHILGVAVSRRTMNLTFCVWALLVNMLQLCWIQTIVVVVVLKQKKPPIVVVPPVLDAVNRNGLAVFVIANLLTGLVNLTMDTLTASHTTAACVLCLYMSMVGLSAVGIQRLKMWIRRRGTLNNTKTD